MTEYRKTLRAQTIAISVIVLCRLFLMFKSPIIGDEAYYWLWGKHPALGFHDHPPLVGWLLSLSTLVSNNPFWIRLPALVCAAGTSIFFFLFAKDILESFEKARTALLFLLLLPILAIISIPTIPDSPLFLAWSLCLWAGWKSLRDERYWPLTGFAVGLALLSKLTGLFLLAGFGLLFLMNPEWKSWAKKKSFRIGAGLAALTSLPFWIWNLIHRGENFLFQVHDRLAVVHHPWLDFTRYAAVQALSVSPLLFFLFLTASAALIKKSREGDLRSQFLLAFSLPIHLTFLFLTLTAKVGFHWAIPGYFALIAAVVSQEYGTKKLRLSLGIAAGMTLILSGVFAFPAQTARLILPLNRAFPELKIASFLQEKDFGEILGYQQLAEKVALRITEARGVNPFLLTPSYSLSSECALYGKIRAGTLLVNGEGAEYAHWNDFSKRKGRDALWLDFRPIDAKPEVKKILQKTFDRIGETETLTITNSPIVRTFYLTPLYRLRNPEALTL